MSILEISMKTNYSFQLSEKFDLFKGDRFLYHLLSRKFDFDDSSIITKSFSSKMFLKIFLRQKFP